MQNNISNKIIADELNVVLNKITQLDKYAIAVSVDEIHSLHRDIESIAREYNLPTLLAIVDWVDLSTEINEDNIQQVETLLTEDAFSNWLDVVISLLKDYNDNLRPVIHQSLTSPQWLVKPSTILLKDIAMWIARIKADHALQDLTNNLNELTEEPSSSEIQAEEKDTSLSSSNNASSMLADSISTSDDVSLGMDAENNHEKDSVVNDLIEEQIQKVNLAEEESMIQSTVFEEVKKEILEKDYTASAELDAIVDEELSTEAPLTETLKSSLDNETIKLENTELSTPADISTLTSFDETIEIYNDVSDSKHDEITVGEENSDKQLISDVSNSETANTAEMNDIEEIINLDSDDYLANELSKIHKELCAININSDDVTLCKDSHLKQLDKLVFTTENTALKDIVPIVDWTQRNIQLFQDNLTPKIHQFVSSGNTWSWIDNVAKCLNHNNKSECLEELTTSLTQSAWLEPIDPNEFEAFLHGLNNTIEAKSVSDEISTVEESAPSDFSAEVNSSLPLSGFSPNDDLPEFLDASTQEEDQTSAVEMVDDNVETVSEETTETDTSEEAVEVATSGLKMTWDDDTHPELLMVYLEETPTQIEQLLPLLKDISANNTDAKGREHAARLAHTIKGGSAVVGITTLAEMSSYLEELLEHSMTAKLNDDMLGKLPEIGQCIQDTFDAVQVQGNEPKEFLGLFNLLKDYQYDLDEALSVEEEQKPSYMMMDEDDLDDDFTEKTISNETTEKFTEDTIEVSNESVLDDAELTQTVEAERMLSEESVSSSEISNELEDHNEISDLTSTETEVSDSNITEIASVAVLSAAALAGKELIEDDKTVTSSETESVVESDTTDETEKETIDQVEESSEEAESVSSEKSGFNMTWNDDTHPELLMVYLEETPNQITELVPLMHKVSENKADSEEKRTASRMAHTIKGGSAIVGLTTLSEMSYRLETILDHAAKHQLPDHILETLPKAATCIEELFDEIQMQGEEPEAYFGIFKTLDHYVNNLEEDDEPLELGSVALPDFILNQNSGVEENETKIETIIDNSEDAPEVKQETTLAEALDEALEEEASDDLEITDEDSTPEETSLESESDDTVIEKESITAEIEEVETETEIAEIEVADAEETLAEDLDSEEADVEETVSEDINSEEAVTDSTDENAVDTIESEATEDIVAEECIETTEVVTEEVVEQTNSVKESIENDSVKLDKLKAKDDVNNIIVEIDDILLNLIATNKLAAEDPATFREKCAIELERFELITELSGYPELTLLSQWCQTNLKSYDKRKKKFLAFIESNEVWSWVEHVSECLRESDDMSHMSSLSVELMREEWLEAIKMEDLQTILLALRHLEDTGVSEAVVEEINTANKDEVISWDKDVHPELLAVYFQETPDQIDQVAGLLHKISRGESSSEENKEAARIAHTIKGSSGVVGLTSLVDLTHLLEDILDYSVNNDITEETADLLSEASDCMESLFETIQNKQHPPEELPSVLESLTAYSGQLGSSSKTSGVIKEVNKDTKQVEVAQVNPAPSINTSNMTKSIAAKPVKPKVDTNESYIRVPIKLIDSLLNLAGELVTTSNQVRDNLDKTQQTNNTIRAQDERVIGMLTDLNKTIEQQEKDQQNLFSSMENSDFDSLEMDSYNELNSVLSLLTESIYDSQEIDNTLSRQLEELSEKLHSLDKLNKTFSDAILSSRMVTIDTIIPRLERIVRQTCRKTNKKAQLIVTGNSLNVDTDILNNLVDPLLHMLRNSIDHGIELPEERVKKNKDETGTISLAFRRDGNNILMSLSDDGAGINPEKIVEKAIEKEIVTADQEFSDSEAIKLILQPGFSIQENITDISGRGVGMDVVNTSIQDLNGTMDINSNMGKGTSFDITIPLTLITNTTLLVRVEDNIIAIPTDTIEQIMYQEANSMTQREDGFYVTHNEVELRTQALGELLDWPHQLIDPDKSYNILIIKSDNKTFAIHVDGIESSREVVVKRLNPWISPSKGVVGACHLNDGGVAPVINLITVTRENYANQISNTKKVNPIKIVKKDIKKKILVVDDSLSNRKALSLIIDKTEFEALTAVDGLDALRVMNENSIDLVFTDLEMPRMNGLELTQSIRAWNDKSKTPIVMITSRTTNKHRELAKKAGVDDYLTKPVETETLLNSIDTWLVTKEALEV